MMPAITLESDSAERTREIGRAIGQALEAGARIALVGPLGAGKTCFVQGLAAGLGCPDKVRSPSFALAHEYEGRCRLYHCDWYRLDTDADVESTGFEDFLRDDAVVVVEWADKHARWLAPPRLVIQIECRDGDRRILRLRDDAGGRYAPALAAAQTPKRAS